MNEDIIKSTEDKNILPQSNIEAKKNTILKKLNIFKKKEKDELLDWLDNTTIKAIDGFDTVDMKFDFAKAEYIRLVGRTDQTVPFLKIIQAKSLIELMAKKAIESDQWQAFESLMLSSMLSGKFLEISSEVQTSIYEICRTRWFLPGTLIKDPKHLEKMQRILNIITATRRRKNKFTKEFPDIGKQTDFVKFNNKFQRRYKKKQRIDKRIIAAFRQDC